MSTPLDGSICTLEDRATPDLHCLSREETIGLTLVTTSGFISLFAVLYLFARIIINVVLESKKPAPRRLVRGPMDVYMLSLFSANLLHAIGETIDIKWVHAGKVFTGGYCSAQGIIQGVAGAAIGLTTLALTIHTFFMIFWSLGTSSLLIPRLTVIILWLFILLLTTIVAATHRHSQNAFYVPTPEWCWIRDSSSNQGYRIAEEYLWLWSALVASLVTYIPLSIWSLKYVGDADRRRMALTMLLYPLVFSILVIPETVVRWSKLKDPYSATLGCQTLFDLIGLVDVVVFFTTRRGLLLFGKDVTEE